MIKKYLTIRNIIIVAMVSLILFIRFAFLSSGEIWGDEPAYSLRSATLIDSLYTGDQTTPVDWFPKEIPSWTSLSFHDHPPLTFWINHVFIKIFGDNLFVYRLVPALFGLLGIIVVYYLAKTMFDHRTGLIAAMLMACNNMLISFSRISLMESITIFFILLSFLFFYKSLENKKYLPLFGVFLGISILAKYTALIIVPVYLIVWFIYRRHFFRERILYFSLGIVFVICLPVIVFNLMMYKNTGHFDVQFASALHQETPEWPSLKGKIQRGSIYDRIAHLRYLFTLISPVLVIAIITSLALVFYQSYRKKQLLTSQASLVITLEIFLLFLIWSGPFARFFVYTIPFFIILVAGMFNQLLDCNKKYRYILILVIVYEILFSTNSVVMAVIAKPLGIPNLTYEKKMYLPDDAIDDLERYLVNIYAGYKPRLLIETRKIAIDSYMRNKANKNNNPKKNILVLYDTRSHIKVRLAVYEKLRISYGWPNLSIDRFIDAQRQKLVGGIFNDAEIYYVHLTDNALKGVMSLRIDEEKFISLLDRKAEKKDSIKNREGVVIYNIYKFSLPLIQEFAFSTTSTLDNIVNNKEV